MFQVRVVFADGKDVLYCERKTMQEAEIEVLNAKKFYIYSHIYIK